jgi:hypothetical protein
MARPDKPEHIQVGDAETKIKVSKYTNRVHIDMTLSIDQEERLLKMLRKRKARRPKK